MARKRADDLTAKMDTMALALLDQANGEDITLITRLDAFEKIGKWVQIKFRIDGDGSGSALDTYKQRINSASEGGPPDRPSRGKPKPFIRNARAERGGAALEAIKRRLPAASVGEPVSNSGGVGGAVPPPVGPFVHLPVGVDGGTGPDTD